jgi:hypothetical protein
LVTWCLMNLLCECTKINHEDYPLLTCWATEILSDLIVSFYFCTLQVHPRILRCVPRTSWTSLKVPFCKKKLFFLLCYYLSRLELRNLAWFWARARISWTVIVHITWFVLTDWNLACYLPVDHNYLLAEDPILTWLVLTELRKELIFTFFISYNVKDWFC